MDIQKNGSFRSDRCQSSCLTQKMWVKKKALTLTLTITKTILFRRKNAEAAKNAATSGSMRRKFVVILIDRNISLSCHCFLTSDQKKLPKLYKLAMRTLSAQATEVPSERAFSAAGLLHTKGRRRQLPGTLCRRLFVYANHPSLLQTRQHQPDSSDDEDEH